MVDPQAAIQFQPYLRPGERLTWTGRPPTGLVFHARDVFLVPFSLMWGGFAIFWEAIVLLSNAPAFFALWGIPFVLAGIYLIAGRFVADAWIRRDTRYGLTDQRALLLRRAFGEKLLTAPLAPVAVSRRRGGRGDLRFGGGPGFTLASVFAPRRSMGWDVWMPGLADTVEFYAIDDVMNAYRLTGQDRPAP